MQQRKRHEYEISKLFTVSENASIFLFGMQQEMITRCYHVIKEVDGPIEGLANACDVLEPLGSAVVLTDFIDGKAGRCDGVPCQHAYSHEDLEQSLDAVKT